MRLYWLFALLPVLTFADDKGTAPSGPRQHRGRPICAENSRVEQIFAKFKDMTDQQIYDRCLYKGILNQRAIDCDKELRALRDKYPEFKEAEQEQCARLQAAAPECQSEGDRRGQYHCMWEAAQKTDEGRAAAVRFAAIMEDVRVGVGELSEYNRLWKEQMTRDKEFLDRFNSHITSGKDGRPDPGKQEVVANPGVRPPETRDPPKKSPTDVPSAIPGKDRSGTVARGETDSASKPVSDISGIKPRDPQLINALQMGFKNLGEYHTQLPIMIQQHQEQEKLFSETQKAAEETRDEQLATAQSFRQSSAQLVKSAAALAPANSELAQLIAQNGGLPDATNSGNGAPAEAFTYDPQALNATAGPKSKANAPAGSRADGYGDEGIATTASKATPAAAGGPSKDEHGNATISKPEDALLANFSRELTGRGSYGGKGRDTGSLRDKLRSKMNGASSMGNATATENASTPKNAGGAVAALSQIMGETGSDSLGRSTSRSLSSLDVDAAVRDMQNELDDTDRATGILESESPDLFTRVKNVHKRSAKNGRIKS